MFDIARRTHEEIGDGVVTAGNDKGSGFSLDALIFRIILEADLRWS